jgi:hypothetical protein
MSYVSDHASALADVQAAGAAVVFTLDTPGDEQTDGTFATPATQTVSGYAIEDGGDPKEYERLGLTVHEAPRLFFVATTYGQEPTPGMTCTWAGRKYTARSAKPFRPDGVAIFTHTIIAR